MSAPQRPENWPELASLVDALLDAPPERRASLIEELSAGDPVRRSALERLRQEIEREPILLGRPAAERFGSATRSRSCLPGRNGFPIPMKPFFPDRKQGTTPS